MKIIVTEEQLKEIIGYCDNNEDDFKYLGGTETTTSSETEDEEGNESYSEPLDTDDYADSITNDIGALWKIGGVSGNLIMRESKKKLQEEKAHGNKDLNNRKFGATEDFKGNSYQAATQKKYRKNKAENELKNGTPEQKEKAQKTLANMYNNSAKNGEDLDVTISNINNAENVSKNVRDNKVKNGISVLDVKTRNSNNGKAHSKKNTNNNIIINYF